IGTSFPRCGNLEQDGSRFHSRTPLISVSLASTIQPWPVWSVMMMGSVCDPEGDSDPKEQTDQGNKVFIQFVRIAFVQCDSFYQEGTRSPQKKTNKPIYDEV
ncbi:hypothetical protein, partial [Ralstonia pseudosolanacearum]